MCQSVCVLGDAFVDDTLALNLSHTPSCPRTSTQTGEEVTAEELGGATLHCSTSGVTDHFAQDERHALSTMRSIVSKLGDRCVMKE
jgi:hypothetical protein